MRHRGLICSGPRKGSKPTVRRAWAEIRDYTQREAQSREAMVSAVKEDVLKELVKMRVGRILEIIYYTAKTSGHADEDPSRIEGELENLE